ncbi:type II toxin-antitoxin system RelE/ParE family toxin [Streptomyces sp. NPDC051776]|uniref:type II toxin-antitoxin system RelE family toxin n=1 Tax=Streptomyces sp. NPDC051776 TaxID=3155414 RepID=UPI00342FC5E3
MIYRVEWRPSAKQKIIEFRKSDLEGTDQVLDAVNALAHDPRPVGARPYGSPDVLRVHVGRYRLMYEVADAVVTITVVHVGRMP